MIQSPQFANPKGQEGRKQNQGGGYCGLREQSEALRVVSIGASEISDPRMELLGRMQLRPPRTDM
jgi:hypothetical protein